MASPAPFMPCGLCGWVCWHSALSRLVKQIVDANGKFRTDLSGDIGRLCGEFSLDNEEGALPALRLAEHNAAYLDGYRFQSLDGFAQLALRARIERRS